MKKNEQKATKGTKKAGSRQGSKAPRPLGELMAEHKQLCQILQKAERRLLGMALVHRRPVLEVCKRLKVWKTMFFRSHSAVLHGWIKAKKPGITILGTTGDIPDALGGEPFGWSLFLDYEAGVVREAEALCETISTHFTPMLEVIAEIEQAKGGGK